MDIHGKITKLRKERGWSLSKLAKEAGIPETTVYNWYNEKHFTPSRDKIEDVCATFGISVAQFYADVDTDELSEQEIRLLEIFNKIPDKNKSKALSMLEMLIE